MALVSRYLVGLTMRVYTISLKDEFLIQNMSVKKLIPVIPSSLCLVYYTQRSLVISSSYSYCSRVKASTPQQNSSLIRPQFCIASPRYNLLYQVTV